MLVLMPSTEKQYQKKQQVPHQLNQYRPEALPCYKSPEAHYSQPAGQLELDQSEICSATQNSLDDSVGAFSEHLIEFD